MPLLPKLQPYKLQCGSSSRIQTSCLPSYAALGRLSSSTWLLASPCTILLLPTAESVIFQFILCLYTFCRVCLLMSACFLFGYCCNGKPLAVWLRLDSCVLDDLSDTEPLCISRVKQDHSKFIFVSFAFLVSWLRKLECSRHVLKNRGFLPSVQKRWYPFFTIKFDNLFVNTARKIFLQH